MQSLRRSADPAPFAHRWCRVKSIEDDHLVVVTWDGTTEGTHQFRVTRPPLLRVAQLVANGWNGITFTKTDSQNVVASSGGNSEDWRVTPLYVVNDLVLVAGPIANHGVVYDPGVTNERVALTDLNVDGRAWAMVPA